MNLIAAFFFVHSLGTAQYNAESDAMSFKQEISVTAATRDSIVDFAKTFLGTPYKYAHASPNSGFDCSGFTWFVYNHFGVAIPRSSQDYMTLGTRVTLETCKKGDLILFTGTDPAEKRVGHVGIIISEAGDSVKFIHSSSSENHFGVTITDYYESAYPKRFIGVCSVLPE